MKWLRRSVLALLAACAALMAGVAIDGFIDRVEPCDVAIVPGSKVNPDGSLSPRLRARVDAALALYRQGVVAHIIVSGGTGREGVDEAVAMKHHLVAAQVPESAVLVDSHGDTTLATAINGAAIMRAHGFRSAVVVTQYFHISRMRMALRAQGIDPVHQAHARFFEWRDLYSLPREAVAVVSYAARLAIARL